MATNDTCCTIVPQLQVNPGRLDEFKAVSGEMVEQTSSESKCLYYGFSFNGDVAHCRGGYVDWRNYGSRRPR